MEPGDTVLVKNLEDKDLKLKYNNREYLIKSKKIMPVPFETICIKFGDPRSLSNEVRYVHGEMPYFIPSRSSELRRLSILYGCYEESDKIAEIAPKVQIRTYDREVLTPVYLDPEGKEAISQPASSLGNDADTANQIHRLQQQILILSQRLGMETVDSPTATVEESFDDILGVQGEEAQDEDVFPGEVARKEIDDDPSFRDETKDDLEADLPTEISGFVKRVPRMPVRVS